jgi:rubrerythrin
MGLFDKKFCDICGDKIGMLGNRKLEDGNMCKNCAGLLSPFTTDRRRTTLADIKEHLAYREANKAEVAAFNVTHTLGGKTKVMLNEDAGKFIVTSSSRWQGENPDVMLFSQVTGCQTEIKESRQELKRLDKDGRSVSYNPPRYDIDYDFYITIHVNSPYFSEITFKINDSRVEQRGSVEYREAQRQADEIKQALTQVRQEVRENIAAANAPRMAQTCPLCGATTTLDASGRCEYCGGAMAQ